MKPILFNTEMVRAIIEGGKTQTRRLVKNQPKKDYFPIGWVSDSTEPKNIGCFGWSNKPKLTCVTHYSKPPYQKEDILYVRETFQESEYFDYSIKDEYYYKADHEIEEYAEEYNVKWRPSIHMPKEAARLFLKVTDLRIEELQNITNGDAVEEGIEFTEIYNDMLDHCAAIGMGTGSLEKQAFAEIWDQIYKSKGYGWNDNHWVWVIEFERCDKPEEGDE